MIVPIHIIQHARKAAQAAAGGDLGNLQKKLKDSPELAQLKQNATAARIIISTILSLILSGSIVATNWGGVGLFYEEPEASVRPGINAEWMNPNVAPLMAKLEDPQREIYRERSAIADAIGLQEGNDVADVGAGSGFLAEEIAVRVGDKGDVYAVELNPALVSYIKTRAASKGLKNLRAHQGTETKLNVGRRDNGNFDFVVLADSYHHLEYPQSMLHSIDRLLRRRGQLIIIEPQRMPGQSSQAVLEHVRLSQAEVIREISDAGFVLVEQPRVPGLQENYMLRFRKD